MKKQNKTLRYGKTISIPIGGTISHTACHCSGDHTPSFCGLSTVGGRRYTGRRAAGGSGRQAEVSVALPGEVRQPAGQVFLSQETRPGNQDCLSGTKHGGIPSRPRRDAEKCCDHFTPQVERGPSDPGQWETPSVPGGCIFSLCFTLTLRGKMETRAHLCVDDCVTKHTDYKGGWPRGEGVLRCPSGR